MALLTVQDISASGLPTFVAAAGGGDTVPAEGGRHGGHELGVALIVRNADAAAKTVTVEGLPGVIVPLAAGTPLVNGVAIIMIPRKHFGAPRTITYSAVTNVSVAAVKLAG